MADEVDQGDRPVVNLGSVISEKLTESLKNMDVMSILQQMVATAPDDEESEVTRDKLRDVLDKYKAMTAEEKVHFTDTIKEALTSRLSAKLSDPSAMNLGQLETQLKGLIMYRLLLVGAGVLILVIIVVFFGYKLYKSIKDKEKKREEKKKAKQMKKKK